MKNEKTSKAVAAIAGRMLERLMKGNGRVAAVYDRGKVSLHVDVCTIAELKAVCASALSQAPDKSKKGGAK